MNPIEVAVSPLKALGMDNAETAARKIVAAIADKVAEFDGVVGLFAAYPSAKMSRSSYRAAERYYKLVRRLVKNIPGTAKSAIDADKVEAFVEEVRVTAGLQFDEYVAKLNLKIGDVIDARMVYSHGVWSDSTLDVRKCDGSVERWNTKVILNHSVHGLPFNQWPTRKVKA